MAEIRKRVGEKTSQAITITPNVSTSTKTVYAYGVTRAGTPVLIGSAAGAGANVAIAITLDWASTGISADEEYKLELVANPLDTNPVTVLPNSAEDTDYFFFVFQVYSIA